MSSEGRGKVALAIVAARENISLIQMWASGRDLEALKADTLVRYAIERAFIAIDSSIRDIPAELLAQHGIPAGMIAGFRNTLAHTYDDILDERVSHDPGRPACARRGLGRDAGCPKALTEAVNAENMKGDADAVNAGDVEVDAAVVFDGEGHGVLAEPSFDADFTHCGFDFGAALMLEFDVVFADGVVVVVFDEVLQIAADVGA